MASQTMLAGMKFSITGTANSHAGTPIDHRCLRCGGIAENEVVAVENSIDVGNILAFKDLGCSFQFKNEYPLSKNSTSLIINSDHYLTHSHCQMLLPRNCEH